MAGCGGSVPEEPAPQRAPVAPEIVRYEGMRVLFLGNSLTAGLGVDPASAFPSLIQHKADSLGWRLTVVNAGLSGETSAGGLSRLSWLLRNHVDVLVLELGGNDGLRGISPEVTKRNLRQIIEITQERYPEATLVLAGMQAPTNLGPAFTSRFREIFPELARETGAALIPFLLEGVGGVAALNQGDGIHPTAAGHKKVAATVWDVLRPLIEARVE